VAWAATNATPAPALREELYRVYDRSAAIAASIVSAMRSPVTFWPARERPLYAKVVAMLCPVYLPATGRGGAPGRPRPAPATTPAPRLIISCSSSRFDDFSIAVSSVIFFC